VIQWIANRTGTLLTAGGSVVLVISLWLPWFDVPRVCRQASVLLCPHSQLSAWVAFRQADWELTLLAAAAVALALAGPAIATALAPDVGVSPRYARAIAHLAVAGAGWIAIALSIIAVHRPSIAAYPAPVPDYGFFVALVAAGAITAGGWWGILFDQGRQT
jgi:hypothetical protein